MGLVQSHDDGCITLMVLLGYVDGERHSTMLNVALWVLDDVLKWTEKWARIGAFALNVCYDVNQQGEALYSAPYCIETIDSVFCSTWSHPTNDCAVSKAGDVKSAEDMALSQSLRACFRSYVVSKKRLCHTGHHMGLYLSFGNRFGSTLCC
jgi:hypothetical protein